MKERKLLDNNGLAHLWLLLKQRFMQKEFKTGSTTEYKVLSDNNLTDALVQKINNAGDSSFSGNYEDLTNKPTLITNDDVNVAINNAIKDIQGISYSIVEELPEEGQAGVIYLVSNSGATSNIYDEYIFVNNGFEKIGTTEVDLSDYLKSTDLVEITNAEIDEIFA